MKHISAFEGKNNVEKDQMPSTIKNILISYSLFAGPGGLGADGAIRGVPPFGLGPRWVAWIIDAAVLIPGWDSILETFALTVITAIAKAKKSFIFVVYLNSRRVFLVLWLTFTYS